MRAHAEDSQSGTDPTVTVNADGTVALSVEPMRARAIHAGAKVEGWCNHRIATADGRGWMGMGIDKPA